MPGIAPTMADEFQAGSDAMDGDRPFRRSFTAETDVPAFQTALREVLTVCGVALDTIQIAQLVKHYHLLGETNTYLNLTRLIGPAEAARWHYLDILAALPCFTGNMPTWWVDVGSGGGFPGLPLAVARPAWRLVLAERRAKKAAFLRRCVSELGLTGRVQVHAGEFEPGTALRVLADCGVDVSRETFGLLARAVEDGPKKLPRLLRLSPFVSAAFWLGQADAEALARQRLPGWRVHPLYHLPTGAQRVVSILTRRAD
ncbi:MAG: RsmG family class I SAM-dependent methyltransferase [Chloracidobacterium sp.]|nr:RsmG family class I SAM-dependent methyltransferase [Chloracidobacterium validum]